MVLLNKDYTKVHVEGSSNLDEHEDAVGQPHRLRWLDTCCWRFQHVHRNHTSFIV